MEFVDAGCGDSRDGLPHCWHFDGHCHKPVSTGWEHQVICCHCGRVALVLVTALQAADVHGAGHGPALTMPRGMSASGFERVA